MTGNVEVTGFNLVKYYTSDLQGRIQKIQKEGAEAAVQSCFLLVLVIPKSSSRCCIGTAALI